MYCTGLLALEQGLLNTYTYPCPKADMTGWSVRSFRCVVKIVSTPNLGLTSHYQLKVGLTEWSIAQNCIANLDTVSLACMHASCK